MNPKTKQQLNGQTTEITEMSVFESELLKSLALMNHHLYEQTQSIRKLSNKVENGLGFIEASIPSFESADQLLNAFARAIYQLKNNPQHPEKS